MNKRHSQGDLLIYSSVKGISFRVVSKRVSPEVLSSRHLDLLLLGLALESLWKKVEWQACTFDILVHSYLANNRTFLISLDNKITKALRTGQDSFDALHARLAFKLRGEIALFLDGLLYFC